MYPRWFAGRSLCLTWFDTCSPHLPQELKDLRKQSEIIPQLMSECDYVSEKLEVSRCHLSWLPWAGAYSCELLL